KLPSHLTRKAKCEGSFSHECWQERAYKTLEMTYDCLAGATCRTIQRKRGRTRVTAAPGAVEAWIDGGSCCNRTIIVRIRDSHLITRLREDSAPSLRNLLTAREGKYQAPTIKSGRTSVGNGNTSREATRPLTTNHVAHFARRRRGCRGRCWRRCDWCRGWRRCDRCRSWCRRCRCHRYRRRS